MNQLLVNLYWITLLAVIASSASGVLKAGFKKFDLFGVIIIAITTGLGGGSLRDLLLSREVFWVIDQVFFIASLSSAIFMFIAARIFAIPQKLFLIMDAAGLATFGIAGTLVAIMMGIPPLLASFMGVLTGAMGGILRDVLCGESPTVFNSQLYATVLWLGSLLFIVLLNLSQNIVFSATIAGFCMFIVRLLAVYFDLSLPKFRFKKAPE
ncbi:MAG: trimeric intracellular cation channel family protein [Gammaproteobacteria bacterium]|nr:trimeric intracellular cation channel family protein [Gammaproteobacteria bacterium]